MLALIARLRRHRLFEPGFERQFALDEAQKFKAEARRDKLLGCGWPKSPA
jgi:hypothetical protein